MNELALSKKLAKLPEFRALESVYAALSPLPPEGRRRVIEAIHALLEVSAGSQHQDSGPVRPSAKTRSHRGR